MTRPELHELIARLIDLKNALEEDEVDAALQWLDAAIKFLQKELDTDNRLGVK